jgi:hypothetical protein
MTGMKAFVIGIMALIASGTAMAAGSSCQSTAGAQQAAELVRQCKAISEATHPPCNALNPCEMMIEEIKRWCAIRREARIAAPKFCAAYSAGTGKAVSPAAAVVGRTRSTEGNARAGSAREGSEILTIVGLR